MAQQLDRVFAALADPTRRDLVARSRDARRRPVHLRAEGLDLMTTWIERYRREAQDRYERLDEVLAAMGDSSNREGAAS